MESKERIKTFSGDELKRNKRTHTIVRSIIQLIFFVSMPGLFAAGFSGIKSIFESISSGAPISFNTLVWALIVLTAFTVVFGRFFCGYACAFGSFGDFIHWISGLIQTKLFKRKKQFEIPAAVSKKFRLLKYLNLAFIVIFVAFALYASLRGTSPWDVFAQLTSFEFNFRLEGYLIGILLLAAIIVLMALKERAFCQYLCPLGAFFALLPMLGILRRNKENCIKGCSICERSCPADLKLDHDGFSNGECIGCGRCAAGCPRANIALPEVKLIKNELAAVIVRAVLLFALGALIGLCRFF